MIENEQGILGGKWHYMALGSILTVGKAEKWRMRKKLRGHGKGQGCPLALASRNILRLT